MKRSIVVGLAVIGALAGLGGLVWLVALTPWWRLAFFEWKDAASERIASLDGRCELVLVRGKAGAVSDFTGDLYVVPKGGAIDRVRDEGSRFFLGGMSGRSWCVIFGTVGRWKLKLGRGRLGIAGRSIGRGGGTAPRSLDRWNGPWCRPEIFNLKDGTDGASWRK